MSDLSYACFVTECVSCGQHKVVTYRSAKSIKDYRCKSKPTAGYYCSDCDPVASVVSRDQRTLDMIYVLATASAVTAVIITALWWVHTHVRITYLP